MLDIDLHCHSNVSDGVLTPAEVVARAAGRGVRALALTDHDDTDGLAEARQAALRHGIEFIPGVEISVSWRSHTVHVVGLHIDPSSPPLAEGLKAVRGGRRERAERMAESLARCGIGGALEGALKYANNPSMIGRTHFARYLVEAGRARDVKSVFKRYLAKGKPGYVSHQWATLTDAVSWIRGSGGYAVLAHPGRYSAGRHGMGSTSLKALLNEFVAIGGEGIEVVTSSHTHGQFAEFSRYAKDFGLYASCGSDFHGPEESWADIGRLPDLPLDCTPIWQLWANEQKQVVNA
jgi:predicted metal-dependent phosphoesterase TrpH